MVCELQEMGNWEVSLWATYKKGPEIMSNSRAVNTHPDCCPDTAFTTDRSNGYIEV